MPPKNEYRESDHTAVKSLGDSLIDDPSGLGVRDRLRFLVKDSMLYGGAGALNKAFALITFPLLARHFSVADYGLIDFFSVLAALMAIFFIFGQDSAVARFFYEYEDEDSRRQIISQSFALQIVFLLFVLPLLWYSADLVSGKLSASPEADVLFRLILLQVPFLVLVNFSQGLLKWMFARTRFLVISVGSVALNTLLLLLAILVFDIGMAGVFQVSLAVQVVFGLLGLYFVRHWLAVPNGVGFLRELLPYAIPYGVICCVSAFVPTMERSLTNNLLGSHELGLYAAGAKVAMLIALVISAFQTAWGPFSLAIHKESDASHTYNWVLKGFSIGMCVAVLLLSAMSEGIIRILASNRYAGAGVAVFPLAMGLAIQGTSWITEIGIGFSKKSYFNLHGYTTFLVATGLAIFLLAPNFGFFGVALGVMIGHVAKAVTASWLAQRAYSLPWQFRPAFTVMACTLVIGLLGSWARSKYDAGVASTLYLVGAALILAHGWLHTFTHQERIKIKEYIGMDLRRSR